MEKLTNTLDKVVIEMTVRNMLNPNNKDFYIPNITIEKLESLVGEDAYASHIFFSAFAIASAQIKPVVKASFQEFIDCYCPKCGRNAYFSNGHCPNCDHYESLVEYCEMQDYLDELKSFRNSKLHQDRFACPECGCRGSQGFVPGCACPNCDNISVIDLSDIF